MLNHNPSLCPLLLTDKKSLLKLHLNIREIEKEKELNSNLV